MPSNPARFAQAIARFDAVHAQDPEREWSDGVEEPRELLYAKRMSACLEALAPDAAEALRLAVRCQHLRRWAIPRSAYPEGAEGYRRWRADEARAHAEAAAGILAEVGYDDATIARVQALVRKERLKRDPDAQLLEDAACVVFLAHHLEAFSHKHDEAAVVTILRKTWSKMSPRGHDAALGLDLPDRLRALLDKALSPVS